MISLNSIVFINHDHFEETPMTVVDIKVDEDNIAHYQLSLQSGAPVGIFTASEIRLPFKTNGLVGRQSTEKNS